MGVSYYAKFMRKIDDPKFQKMVAAVEALQAAEIWDMPEDLKKYFKQDHVDGFDVNEELTIQDVNLSYDYGRELPEGVTRIEDYESGILIDLDELPAEIRQIRVTISC